MMPKIFFLLLAVITSYSIHYTKLYDMTKSQLRTLQRRFQGCMENALLAVLPIGSKEMVGLEVYVTDLAKGKTIAIPGLKR